MAETKNAPKGAAGAQPAKTGEAAAAKGEAAAKAPAAGINKMEAVRRALAKLGQNALPSEMKPYIQKTFGIEMTTDHISTYKGDIARKAREAAQQAAAKKPAAPKPEAAPKPQVPAAKAPAVAAPRTEGGNGEHVGGSILLEDVLTTKELLDRVGPDKLRTLIDGLTK